MQDTSYQLFLLQALHVRAFLGMHFHFVIPFHLQDLMLFYIRAKRLFVLYSMKNLIHKKCFYVAI